MSLKSIRFTHVSLPYCAGDIAGFEPAVADKLIKAGVAVPAGEEPAADETAERVIVQRDLEFLQSRGYKVETVDEAAAFIGNLPADERAAYFTECDAWIPDEDLEALTKAQLVARGTQLGLDLNERSTKADLIEAILDKIAANNAAGDVAGSTTETGAP